MCKLLNEIRHVTKMHYNALLIAVICILLWMFAFHEAIVSAARVWWVSEIYSHGYFVLPISGYLVWRKRKELAKVKPNPAYFVLIPLILSALIYIIGVAGNISLFQHAAIFSILPLTIWLVFGTSVAKVILFPLTFIVFSIPFGEEFIPYLQKITADVSVLILRFIDIPVFRNGLYIEIPNGRFIVAEACSGIRFFIGAAVFGAIYAYINYTSRVKQFIFFGVSLIVPIIANIIRVSVIILIGYISDMKYAAGVDHLVYGWIFFAIVIVLLIFVGNIWADDLVESVNKYTATEKSSYRLVPTEFIPVFIVLGIYIILSFWTSVIETNKQNHTIATETTKISIQKIVGEYWQPKFKNASEIEYDEYIVSNNKKIDYYSAFYQYNTQKTELISSANRIYDPNDWTIKKSRPYDIRLNSGEKISAYSCSVIGRNQEYRLILYWYEVGSLYTSNRSFIKLYQAYDAILAKPGSGRVVIYSMKHHEDDLLDMKNILINFIKINHKTKRM
jgi:exosortase A